MLAAGQPAGRPKPMPVREEGPDVWVPVRRRGQMLPRDGRRRGGHCGAAASGSSAFARLGVIRCGRAPGVCGPAVCRLRQRLILRHDVVVRSTDARIGRLIPPPARLFGKRSIARSVVDPSHGCDHSSNLQKQFPSKVRSSDCCHDHLRSCSLPSRSQSIRRVVLLPGWRSFYWPIILAFLDVPKTLGERLKTPGAGNTRERAAARLGTDEGALQHYEGVSRRPSTSRARRIVEDFLDAPGRHRT